MSVWNGAGALHPVSQADYLVTSSGEPEMTGQIEDLVLKFTADHFKFDSSRLEPDMIAWLDAVMAKIAASPGAKIISHTDSSGPENYNQGLSERRAQAVSRYRVEQGFSRDILSVSNMSESQPVADNTEREGRTMNRRAEILTH